MYFIQKLLNSTQQIFLFIPPHNQNLDPNKSKKSMKDKYYLIFKPIKEVYICSRKKKEHN